MLRGLVSVYRNCFELLVKMIAASPIASVHHSNPGGADVALLVSMRFCQSCGLDHGRHAGLIASSVMECSCVE